MVSLRLAILPELKKAPADDHHACSFLRPPAVAVAAAIVKRVQPCGATYGQAGEFPFVLRTAADSTRSPHARSSTTNHPAAECA